MTGSESEHSAVTSVVHFFLLTFAFSWMIWIPMAVWKPAPALMMQTEVISTLLHVAVAVVVVVVWGAGTLARDRRR